MKLLPVATSSPMKRLSETIREKNQLDQAAYLICIAVQHVFQSINKAIQS